MSESISPATDEARAPGRIVTFYSYKGGTGRSMALANVAWLLAGNGLKVLVIDWDLEAPGLHRYFHPFIDDKDLSSTPGIIDYFVDLSMSARRAYARPPAADEPRWFEPYTVLLRYSRSLEFEFPGEGTIDFVCAGQQDRAYSERVTSFDWRGFYEALGGGVVLEALKQRLRADYDYVLIDSRTGISDTSGICTVQMPDDLVVMFTLNRQSIRGASAAARSAFDQRRCPDGRPGLRIFPVRTRVERVEALRLRAAKDMAISAFDDLLWHLSPEERQSYWGRMEVPYQPFYAHEEVLAPFADGEPESGSMLAAMQVLAELLAGERAARKPSLAESLRKEYLGRFLPELAPKPAPPASRAPARADFALELDSRKSKASHPESDSYRYWLYVGYSSTDEDAYLSQFVDDIRAELMVLMGKQPSIFFDQSSVSAADTWLERQVDAIAHCRVALTLYSPGYFVDGLCRREFAMLAARATQNGAGLIPVEWVNAPQRQKYELAMRYPIFTPTPDGLRSLARRRRSHEYLGAVRELAAEIVNLGEKQPLAILPADELLAVNALS
jgi:hypothetical protein